MKFYIPNDRISMIEEYDCAWLMPADFNPHKKAIVLYEWANGWIIESDDYFNTYFVLMTGKKLPTITDDEYKQFVMDKIAFLSKARNNEFKTAWLEFRPKRPK